MVPLYTNYFFVSISKIATRSCVFLCNITPDICSNPPGSGNKSMSEYTVIVRRDIMYRRRLKSLQRALLSWGVIFAAIFVCALLFFEHHARPILESITVNYGKTFATESINTAVMDIIDNGDYSYEDLVSINYSQDGIVSSITADTRKINRLKSDITLSAQKNIGVQTSASLDTRMGVLTGIELLKNLGPRITVKTSLTGGVETEIVSRFESRGINQSIHIIEVIVTASISTYSSGVKCDSQIKTNIPIAQTIVLGDVPKLLYSDDYVDAFD